MANKYKRISQEQLKKTQDDSNLRMIMAAVIGVLIIVAVLVALLLNQGNKGQAQQPGAGGTQQSAQQTQDLKQLQDRVAQSEKTAQANPTDYNALVNLGNAYYDLASASFDNNKQTDAQTYFAKAVDPYQKALAQKFDINVQTDMATAAFYGGKDDVADAAFKTAIEKQPDFLTARFNYGVFLKEVKNDKEGARKQMEYVANQTKDADAAAKAKQFIDNNLK